RLPGIFSLFLNGKFSETKPVVHQRNVDAVLNEMLEDLNSKLVLTEDVGILREPLEIDPGNFVLKYRAMEGYFMSFAKNFEEDEEEVFFEPDLLLEMYKVKYLNLLERCKQVLGDIRVNIYFTVRFAKAFDPTNQVTGHFSSTATVFHKPEDLDGMIEKILQSICKFQAEGSGWIVHRCEATEVLVGIYRPLVGGSYKPLPEKLKGISNKILLNVYNPNDDRCFVWSVLASIHRIEEQQWDRERYVPYESELDLSVFSEYPVGLMDIEEFERANKISESVFGFENGEPCIYRVSQFEEGNHHVDLLYLDQHYVAILDFNKFVAAFNENRHLKYFCRRYMHGFRDEDRFEREHKPQC